jgi:hypothetical protein
MIVRPGDTVVLAFDKDCSADDLHHAMTSLLETHQGVNIKVWGVAGLLDSFIIRSDET